VIRSDDDDDDDDDDADADADDELSKIRCSTGGKRP
jgi:hypothetical protein